MLASHDRERETDGRTDLGEVALVGVEVVDVDVLLRVGDPPALAAAGRRRHCGLASAAADHLCSGTVEVKAPSGPGTEEGVCCKGGSRSRY
jgi:hypothetical protein